MREFYPIISDETARMTAESFLQEMREQKRAFDLFEDIEPGAGSVHLPTIVFTSKWPKQ